MRAECVRLQQQALLKPPIWLKLSWSEFKKNRPTDEQKHCMIFQNVSFLRTGVKASKINYPVKAQMRITAWKEVFNIWNLDWKPIFLQQTV